MKRQNKILVATAVAGLMALTGGTGLMAKEKGSSAKVKCYGGNACKGQGACGGVHKSGESYSCAGNNECKGQGFTKTTAEDCEAKGGSTTKPKKKS
jgi:hypothetical protein